MPSVPNSGSVGLRVWNAITGANVAAYRLTGGRVGGRWKRRNPILLLEHVGRRSGERRTTPLVYTTHGDDLLLVASRGGSDRNPGWLHNLRANPDTSVRVGRERRDITARVASAEERETMWPLLVEANPDYATYEEQTDREIPVVVLSPRRLSPAARP
jgi:deazaflavin-dependent oxidoreductase (nitroreductase family)